MNHLFENASLQVLLRAFSMDVNTFSYILNFYVSYNGIYALLMGVIFSAMLGVQLFSKELTSGTYEFLYSNPISRSKIFISKSMVVVIYLLLLNFVIFIVGFVGMELLKDKSPQIPWLSEENIEVLEAKVDLSNIMALFELDDDLFYANIYSGMERDFTSSLSFDSMPEIDGDTITNLLAVFLTNPDGIFDEMLDNPKRYMPLFKMTNETLYKTLMNTQKDVYFENKRKFKIDEVYVLEQFRKKPDLFLEQIVNQDKVEAFSNHINLTKKQEDDLFIYYSFSNFVDLSFVTFVVMLSVASFSIMLTVIVPKGKYSSGVATGVAFFFYMVSTMSNITEKTEFLKYFSPLAYLNMDVMAIDYHTATWSWISVILIIIISSSIAIISFNKNDLMS